MRVLLLAMTWDTAGQGAAIRAALATERPAWRVDQVAAKVKGFGYPRQHAYAPDLVRSLWRRADVVHLNLSPAAVRTFGRRPGLVVHHHGSEYRYSRAAMDASCRRVGAAQVASTLDLTGPATWLPTVVDVDAIAALRDPGPVTVAHSPSMRRLKQTEAVIAATDATGLALDLIEHVPWAECLVRKGRAAIVVDQLLLGYGLSAIEAWCMGIPVVAGVADPETRRRMLATFGVLPFVDATPETLPERLAELAASADMRAEWGERGRAHVLRFHSQLAVAERLEAIYRRAA